MTNSNAVDVHLAGGGKVELNADSFVIDEDGNLFVNHGDLTVAAFAYKAWSHVQHVNSRQAGESTNIGDLSVRIDVDDSSLREWALRFVRDRGKS